MNLEKLKSKCSAKGLVLPATNKVVVPITISLHSYLTNREIGFATDLSISQSRTVERIREIGGVTAGQVIEGVSYVENYRLTISGVALYNSTLLSRLYGAYWEYEELSVERLLLGRTPFNLRVYFRHPGEKIDERLKKFCHYLEFIECHIAEYSTEIRIQNAVVVETITAQPVAVRVIDYSQDYPIPIESSVWFEFQKFL